MSHLKAILTVSAICCVTILYITACTKETETIVDQSSTTATALDTEYYTVHYVGKDQKWSKIVQGKKTLEKVIWDSESNLVNATVNSCNSNVDQLDAIFSYLRDITNTDIPNGHYLRTKIKEYVLDRTIFSEDLIIEEHKYALLPLKDDLLKECKTDLYTISWGNGDKFEFESTGNFNEAVYYFNEAFNSGLGHIKMSYIPAATSQLHFDKGEYVLTSFLPEGN